MSLDISRILQGWEFKPDVVTVRSIVGDDGRERVQLRLDLGVMQMEVSGRPDGERIHGEESLLDLHRKRQREHDEANPDGAPYLLETEDCAELMREGVQYYHRYVTFWQLGRYEQCARDTRRNLQLFRFVREHARYDRDKVQFDQWRPYVTMMHARAVATPLVELGQHEAALGAIDAGIQGIEQFLMDYGQSAEATRVGELLFLRRWRREVVKLSGGPDGPVADDEDDPVTHLRGQLESAIGEERYEDAAQLRDELKRLEEPPPPGAIGG